MHNQPSTLHLLLFQLLCGLLFCTSCWDSSFAAPTKYRYPLGILSRYTTYRDNNPSSGIIDWNGGKYTYNGHEGTDFAVSKGSPIYAAASGVVEEVIDGKFDDCRTGTCSPPSNRVRIRHDDGQVTYYLHMKKWSIVVRKGQRVQCGQKIGEVASSGRSTGNHLHFQIGHFRKSKEPFKGPKGARTSLWTSQGKYGRSNAVPGSQCATSTPSCTRDTDCKDPSKPTCSNGICIPKPPPGCSFVKTVRLNGLTLNMRAQSTTSSSVVTSIPEGVCLQVLHRTQGQSIQGKTTWYQVQYNGKTGWITAAFADCSTCGGECQPGQKRSCYDGKQGTQGVGRCKAGQQLCNSVRKWGICTQQITPQKEDCSNQVDDDCDGQVNEGCAQCVEGIQRPCTTRLQGICKEGQQSCKRGVWEVCKAKHTPRKELCNQKDDDCDGQIDEGICPTECHDRDKDGYRVGSQCPAGSTLDCDDNHPSIHPGAREICGNGIDEDCDQKDLSCLPLGMYNCTHNKACSSGFCYTYKGRSICSEPCKTHTDCPTDYTCLQQTGCWPSQSLPEGSTDRDASVSEPLSVPESSIHQETRSHEGGTHTLRCQENAHCAAGERCQKGRCIALAPRRKGCSCNMGDPSLPLLPLFILAWMFLSRRQQRQDG